MASLPQIVYKPEFCPVPIRVILSVPQGPETPKFVFEGNQTVWIPFLETTAIFEAGTRVNCLLSFFRNFFSPCFCTTIFLGFVFACSFFQLFTGQLSPNCHNFCSNFGTSSVKGHRIERCCLSPPRLFHDLFPK